MAARRDGHSDEEDTKMHIINYPPGADSLWPAGWSHLYMMPGQPDQIIKVPLPLEMYETAHEIERRIYNRLGKHPNLTSVVRMDEYGIYLARAKHGCIYESYMNGGTATLPERIKWCRDVAEVVESVHQNGVRHADLTGQNLLLDTARNILLCDFAGSFIDGGKVLVVAEAGYRHPDRGEYLLPTMRFEIHSLRSSFYEIITSKQLHHGLQDSEVGLPLEAKKYPDVKDTPLGDAIAKCWEGALTQPPK